MARPLRLALPIQFSLEIIKVKISVITADLVIVIMCSLVSCQMIQLMNSLGRYSRGFLPNPVKIHNGNWREEERDAVNMIHIRAMNVNQPINQS